MTLLIIIQLILAILLVIFVLIQGSDNEGLGLGGGGGLGGMMSARGSANLLSRLTAITASFEQTLAPEDLKQLCTCSGNACNGDSASTPSAPTPSTPATASTYTQAASFSLLLQWPD